MAKRQIVEYRDDLDPTEEAQESVTFGLDGVTYSIDLTGKHATALRDFLATYVTAAERVYGTPRRRELGAPVQVPVGYAQSRTVERNQASRPVAGYARQQLAERVDPKLVRRWAQQHDIRTDDGRSVSDFGRVHHDIERKYRDRHDTAGSAATETTTEIAAEVAAEIAAEAVVPPPPVPAAAFSSPETATEEPVKAVPARKAAPAKTVPPPAVPTPRKAAATKSTAGRSAGPFKAAAAAKAAPAKKAAAGKK